MTSTVNSTASHALSTSDDKPIDIWPVLLDYSIDLWPVQI